MKKHLLYLLPLACAVLLAGCKKEAWYHNTDVVIMVENESGDNLLDPRQGGNILDNGISISYKGDTYELMGIPSSRAYEAPVFGGLRFWTSWSANVPDRMAFGQFGIVSDSSRGVREYRGEPFTINWGDGTTSDLTFDLSYSPGKKDGDGLITQAVRVTGGVGLGTEGTYNSLIITIVK